MPEETVSPPVVNTVTSTVQPSIVASTTDAPESDNECFFAEPELCQQQNDNENCKECIPHPRIKNSLVCCNVTDIEKALSCLSNPGADNSSYWENVHIRNATLDELDISHKFWKRLKTFAITDGNVKKIVKEFPKFSSPKCVNMSNNNLATITPRAFKELIQLQVLDISNNSLSVMPNLNSNSINLTIDIR